MSKVINVNEEVKEVIKEIITKHHLDPNSEIVYGVGSEIGDGFMSKTATVDITDGKETLHLFVKYSLNIKSNVMSLDDVYATETHFFNVIYPDFLKFAQDKGMEDALNNIPKCYAASEKNVVALENLKKRGYAMLDATIPMDADHLSATFKSLARYHALSFSFKDQNKDRYQVITGQLPNNNFESMKKMMEDMQVPMFNRFINELDPVKDKTIVDQRDNINEKVAGYFKKICTNMDENSILSKGDNWVNNLMFRYEDKNRKSPADVILIDWQMTKVESIVHDLSVFFFTAAATEDLKKQTCYMKLYHDELSEYMRKLGSNPDKIFPFSTFEEEWRQHCIYGYATAVLFLFNMFCPKPDFANLDLEKMHMDIQNITAMFLQAPLPADYITRLRDLTEIYIEYNL